jgi:hypothetical protein
VAERRAIERLDIPYFSVAADGTDLCADGRTVVPGYFTRSGLDAARSRIDALSNRTLRAGVAAIGRAVSESVVSRYAAAPPPVDHSPAGAVAFARWIGRELRTRAETCADGLQWNYLRADLGDGWARHRLYDGTLGPALLFAALAAVDDDERWREDAAAALRPIARALERELPGDGTEEANLGGADGLGSIVYGLTIASALTGERRWLEGARAVAERIGTRIDTATQVDVIDGLAGAALALLALFEASGDDAALRIARACGERLLRVGAAASDQRARAAVPGHRRCAVPRRRAGRRRVRRRPVPAVGAELRDRGGRRPPGESARDAGVVSRGAGCPDRPRPGA